jgi:histidinol-phosphate aminotransferase
VADYFGVPVECLLLTNGLDEGILAVAGAAFRDRTRGVPDAVGVEPAFDMYQTCTTALGGRMVAVPLGDDLTLSLDAIRDALTPATRVAFLTNPHNPSGTAIPCGGFGPLAADLALATGNSALLFVDETYAEFAGDTVISPSALEATPNMVVGRTFSKAFGLAGLRAGALIAAPATLEPIRQVVPPYSLNAWAAAALPAAIGDHAYRDWYIGQAKQSRAMLVQACERLGLRTWRSAANFQLVRIGPRASEVVAAMAARGVLVRDRSRERGSEHCIRITAGVVEDTRRAIAALEEALCAAP